MTYFTRIFKPCWVIKTANNVMSRSLPSRYTEISAHINCAYRCMTTEKEEKKIVIQQEDVVYHPREIRMDWEGLKRSWKYVIKTAKAYMGKPKNHEAFYRLYKHDHVVYYFRTPGDLTYWYVMTDEDYGGHSWAELRQGQNEMTALFRGYLSERRPKDLLPANDPLQMQPPYHGMVYLETKPFLTILDKREYMNLSPFNAIKLRFRGDGRRYDFEMVCDTGFDKKISYAVPIYTRGGPFWQELEIPYYKFFAKKEEGGVLLVRQKGMHFSMIENFRFRLQDGIEGPFQLELDYIALTRDPTEPMEGNDNVDPWQPINNAVG